MPLNRYAITTTGAAAILAATLVFTAAPSTAAKAVVAKTSQILVYRVTAPFGSDTDRLLDLGLDVMEEQVEKARQRYPQYEFLVQDATNLHQFADGSKDVVVIFGVLHHIPEWRKVIDEVKRILKPNGSFFVEEPRGMDLKLFDFFFRWGHPDSDFGVNRMEEYLKSRSFKISNKQWTPLMTMVHALKNLAKLS